jgi:transketolase
MATTASSDCATRLGDDIVSLQVAAAAARSHVIRAVAQAEAGHIGGPLSAIDILTCLYFRVLNVNPDDPTWEDRDRFVLSKGHSAIGLYAVMALRGYFPLSELETFDQIDSRLQGHPDMNLTPGIDMSSGSLGLGFSGAIGLALGSALTKRPFHTYVMLGDGECNEGIVWEGAHVASKYGLERLTAIVDLNRLQQYGWKGDKSARRPPYNENDLADRWRAFGWHVQDADGHDMNSIIAAFEAPTPEGTPKVIVARTVKGRGVSFMENDFAWHARVPNREEVERALAELETPIPANTT